MALNIKNPRVHELAREAAAATGKTQTSVIEEALERYLAEITEPDRAQEATQRVEVILHTMRAALAGRGPELRGAVDDLYDPTTGLPR